MGVGVPDIAGAPTNAEELLESAVLDNTRFHCRKCQGVIGQIVDIGLGVVKL